MLVFSVINLCFFLAHLAMDFLREGGVYSLFDLDREGNLPSWYSSSQLLVAGLFVGAFLVRNIHTRGIWIVALLSATCLAMSVDEAAGLHERVGDWSDDLIAQRETMVMAKTGTWMFIVGVPFTVAIVPGLIKLNHVLADCKGAARRFVAGFAVLLIGAVGLETLSNFVIPATPIATLQVATEELVEMMGGSILLWASYMLLRTHWTTAGIWTALSPLPKRS